MSMPDLETVRGALLPGSETVFSAVLELLVSSIERDVVDAVLLPHETPDGDSYAYILSRDTGLVRSGEPLPPIVPINGGRVVMSLKKSGGRNLRIAAVMRPCEVRAAVELSKLRQVDLENLILISMDCPGAIPLSRWFADRDAADDQFAAPGDTPDDDSLRPICRICDCTDITSSDLHMGTRGLPRGDASLIACTEQGARFLESMDMTMTADLTAWRKNTRDTRSERAGRRETFFAEYKDQHTGIDGLGKALAGCIGCHICRDVCPLCICRECYFDSGDIHPWADDYLQRVGDTGSLRFPSGTALFHIGRMTHMSFQCVSCGACEDACPAELPVSRLFSLVGTATAGVFDYRPGLDRTEEIPLNTYRESELEELDGSREEVAS